MSEQYRLFDHVVESEIPFEETAPLNQKNPVDIIIRSGALSVNPSCLPETVYYGKEKKWWYCLPNKDTFIFNTPAGQYEIKNGHEIIVQQADGAAMQDVRAYLLGTAFGVLQIQRGLFPMHGGCVALDDKALIITGQQGAGKSTLTGMLINQGFRYLADDVATVSVGLESAVVLPAYPQRKLCRDACIEQGHDPERLVRISEERDKYAVRDRDRWCEKRLPLKRIIELVPMDMDKPVTERVEGAQKLGLILRSLYRPWIHKARGIEPAEMKKLLSVAAGVEAFRICRTQGKTSVGETVEAIYSACGR